LDPTRWDQLEEWGFNSVRNTTVQFIFDYGFQGNAE
jgi:hypothetical protein